MTRIDFAFGAPDRLRTACNLVAKHYQAKQPIVVYCQDMALLEQLNGLLSVALHWQVSLGPPGYRRHSLAQRQRQRRHRSASTAACSVPSESGVTEVSMATGTGTPWRRGHEQAPIRTPALMAARE
jgi:hypothetical protein